MKFKPNVSMLSSEPLDCCLIRDLTIRSVPLLDPESDQDRIYFTLVIQTAGLAVERITEIVGKAPTVTYSEFSNKEEVELDEGFDLIWVINTTELHSVNPSDHIRELTSGVNEAWFERINSSSLKTRSYVRMFFECGRSGTKAKFENDDLVRLSKLGVPMVINFYIL